MCAFRGSSPSSSTGVTSGAWIRHFTYQQNLVLQDLSSAVVNERDQLSYLVCVSIAMELKPNQKGEGEEKRGV